MSTDHDRFRDTLAIGRRLLRGARAAALALAERAKANARPSMALFSAGPDPEDEALLKTLSELTEDRVERYYF